MKRFSFFHKQFVLVHAVTLFLSLVGLCYGQHALAAEDIESCDTCHQDTIDAASSKYYVHQPVAEMQCGSCHIRQAGKQTPKARKDVDTDEIDWFVRDYVLRRDHWLELPLSMAGATLHLAAHGPQGGGKALVTLPPLTLAQEFSKKEPVAEIFDLKVVEVKRGVFISARLQWKTTRLAQTACLYGEKEIISPEQEGEEKIWGMEHEVILSGLARGRTYRFRAVAIDVFGQQSLSPEISFSTSAFFAPAEPKNAQLTPSPPPFSLQTEFWRSEGRLFGLFRSNVDVALKLGHVKVDPASVDGANRPEEHLPLTDRYTLNLTVCYECHPQTHGELSHPVNVRPLAGMNIPADSQLLVNGKLSCMSCHEVHGSNNLYRLTFKTNKQLCLSCHRNFG